MIIAALLVFGALLVAWLMAPTDGRPQPRRPADVRVTTDTVTEVLAEAA